MKAIYQWVYSLAVILLSVLHVSCVHTSEEGIFELIEKNKIEAQRIAESQKKQAQESKKQLDAAKAEFFTINETLNHISPDTITQVLKKQDNLVTVSFDLSRQIAHSSLGITFIEEDIQELKVQLGTPEDLLDELVAFKQSAQKSLMQAEDAADDIIRTTQKAILLITDKLLLKHASLDKTILVSLIHAQETMLGLVIEGMLDRAKEASGLIVQIGELLTGKPEGVDPVKKAKELERAIEKMLPPPPPAVTPAVPVEQPAAPTTPAVTPSVSSVPLPQTPAAPTMPQPALPRAPSAPGKGIENINKINSKLNSALRRLDNIKKYYNELDKEERAVIRKKAENIAHDYESSFVGLIQRIQQVKQTHGSQLDPAKVAPFNTFIDLFNRLVTSIKGL